jgi:hypothetical protein
MVLVPRSTYGTLTQPAPYKVPFVVLVWWGPPDPIGVVGSWNLVPNQRKDKKQKEKRRDVKEKRREEKRRREEKNRTVKNIKEQERKEKNTKVEKTKTLTTVCVRSLSWSKFSGSGRPSRAVRF